MKNSGTMAAAMVAPCGVNCAACSAHVGNQKPCPGCRGPKGEIARKSCRDCLKKKCAFEKGLTWCFQCMEFPCKAIKTLDRRYLNSYQISPVQNGLAAKDNMEAFLADQQKLFTCQRCGGAIDLHHKKCSACKVPW